MTWRGVAAPDSTVSRAELVAAASKATDLGMGQPLATAVSTCLVSMRVGRASGLPLSELRDAYHLALLRYIGCSAETHTLAAAAGDELALRRAFAAIDPGSPSEVGMLAGRYFAPDAMASLPALMHEQFTGHCEVAQRLAERMGFNTSLIACLGQLYERWDGRGQPRGLRGEEVARPVMLVTLAQDVVIASRTGGLDAVIRVARERAGAAYDAALVSCFCDIAVPALEGIDDEPAWSTVLSLEPGGATALDAEQLDACCEALADFADLKSPHLVGHSRGVAALAAAAAQRARLSAADVADVRRAALLHDLGRVGVSAGIWAKPRLFNEREWEEVRLHPYHTERVLAQPAGLARLGLLASHHHERLDGSGYHRGSRSAALSPGARLIAAADVYHALTEERPHRPALSAREAERTINAEVQSGRLDGDAVSAVLGGAGHPVSVASQPFRAGLSRREQEVLRLLARGLSNRQMAAELHVAPETVKRHVQHIYDKAGVATRAGATLFAVENALL